MSDHFAKRLRLALDALSMSRGRLAAELGVDKSLVGRWASGTGGPSPLNREGLTRLIATKRPGFTLLDWERELADFAALFGVTIAEPPATPANGVPASLLQLVRPAGDADVTPYEGFWRTTHASLFEPGRFCQQHGMFRRAADGVLKFELGADGVRYGGVMFPIEGQLFAVVGDNVRNLPALMILNVVSMPKIVLLDGLLLAASSSLRIPSAYTIIFERIGDLSGDPSRDDAHVADLMKRPEVLEDSDALPEIVRDHLLRDFGPEAASRGGELMLSAPLTRKLAQIVALSGQSRA